MAVRLGKSVEYNVHTCVQLPSVKPEMCRCQGLLYFCAHQSCKRQLQKGTILVFDQVLPSERAGATGRYLVTK